MRTITENDKVNALSFKSVKHFINPDTLLMYIQFNKKIF